MSRSNIKRHIITNENPKSPISEAYRTLRTNIDFSSADDRIQVIIVISATAGEGKSTTVCNLAAAYAQSEKKVIVIDADLRKPTMHQTFMKSNRQGLTNILTGQLNWNDLILPTHIYDLDLIPSGPIPPNPSEILSSKRMSLLLDALKCFYDVIIIDTPPALAVTDAQMLSTKSDGVILVAESGQIKRDAIRKVKESLEHVHARILGVVLNNVSGKNGQDYYRYYYGSK